MTTSLRWVIFTTSVVSDHDNPGAHLYRALGRILYHQRHDAIFFEQRGNRWLRESLLVRGASPLRAFREKHQLVEYRTYELRTGAEHVEWLTRVLSTADVTLVDREAPTPVVEWVGQLTRAHLQTYLIDTSLRLEPDPIMTGAAGDYVGVVTLGADRARQLGTGSHAEKLVTLDLPNATQTGDFEWDEIARNLAAYVERTARTERKRHGRG
jgi:hypothetical protein